MADAASVQYKGGMQMCFSDDLANKKPVQVMGSFIKAFGISLSLNKQNAARIKEEDVWAYIQSRLNQLGLSE